MKTSYPNSPNFRPERWEASYNSLNRNNDPKAETAVAVAVEPVAVAVVTDAEIETQKVVNVMGIDPQDKVAEAMDKAAALLNLGVPALKALCKSRGLVRYSKLKKADLQALLAE